MPLILFINFMDFQTQPSKWLGVTALVASGSVLCCFVDDVVLLALSADGLKLVVSQAGGHLGQACSRV